MDKTTRCESRDQHGHRCNQKTGHNAHNDYHSSFGHNWSALPWVAPVKSKRAKKKAARAAV